jgi:hypothetical protein
MIAFRVLRLRRRAVIPLQTLLASYPRPSQHSDGDVGDDGAGRAGRRSAPRRLDHRQHLLAWIFYINIPVGLAAAATTSRSTAAATGAEKTKLDYAAWAC